MLSVYNRISVCRYITEMYIKIHQKVDQFTVIEIDVPQLIAELIEATIEGKRRIQLLSVFMGEELVVKYNALVQNLIDNKQEAIEFAIKLIAMCNAGHQVGVN